MGRPPSTSGIVPTNGDISKKKSPDGFRCTLVGVQRYWKLINDKPTPQSDTKFAIDMVNTPNTTSYPLIKVTPETKKATRVFEKVRRNGQNVKLREIIMIAHYLKIPASALLAYTHLVSDDLNNHLSGKPAEESKVELLTLIQKNIDFMTTLKLLLKNDKVDAPYFFKPSKDITSKDGATEKTYLAHVELLRHACNVTNKTDQPSDKLYLKIGGRKRAT
jgi:hypothetical protein